MPKRPKVVAPKFGEWLKATREARGLSFGEAANRLRPYVKGAEMKMDRSNLLRFEQGRVPNWPAMAAFSRVYGVALEELAARLATSIEYKGSKDVIVLFEAHGTGRDLLGHGAEVQEAPNLRGADASVEARMVQLQAELEDREARLREVQDVAEQLVEIIGAGPKGSAARKGTRARSRGHRKAG